VVPEDANAPNYVTTDKVFSLKNYKK